MNEVEVWQDLSVKDRQKFIKTFFSNKLINTAETEKNLFALFCNKTISEVKQIINDIYLDIQNRKYVNIATKLDIDLDMDFSNPCTNDKTTLEFIKQKESDLRKQTQERLEKGQADELKDLEIATMTTTQQQTGFNISGNIVTDAKTISRELMELMPLMTSVDTLHDETREIEAIHFAKEAQSFLCSKTPQSGTIEVIASQRGGSYGPGTLSMGQYAACLKLSQSRAILFPAKALRNQFTEKTVTEIAQMTVAEDGSIEAVTKNEQNKNKPEQQNTQHDYEVEEQEDEGRSQYDDVMQSITGRF